MRQTFWRRGGGWALAQSVLMSGVIALGVVFHGDWTNIAVIASGAVLLLVGGVVGLAGVLVLGRGTTPLPKPAEQARLVQTGIFARVRHPLYTSVMLASLGWALIRQSWPSLLAATVLLPFFHAKARREERWLREQFPDYADYERRVPRFLPRLKRQSRLNRHG